MIELAPNNPYGLTLKTPMIAAAGCLGYGVEYARLLSLASSEQHGLGAIITRTTTLRPRRARPGPALIETAAGVLHCGGSQNPGLRIVVERMAPIWENWSLPIIVSVAGESLQEYTEIAEHLANSAGVAAIETPLQGYNSLPLSEAGRIIGALRKSCQLPLIAKVPVSGVELPALIDGLSAAGADAVSLSGGMSGLAVESATGTLRDGQLCGPCLRPLALAAVAQACAANQLPIIGGGGISDLASAQAYLQLGASALSVGSALVRDPRLAADLQQGLTATEQSQQTL
jgi:dihydroorotate dehydrogenase (NAD+) catalytic subunit